MGRAAAMSSGLAGPPARVALIAGHVAGAALPAAYPRGIDRRRSRWQACERWQACSHSGQAGRPLAASAAAIAAFAVARQRHGAGSRRSVMMAATAAQDTHRAATGGDAVRVNYEGRLEDGSIFDSSAGRAPLSFTIGRREVVPGFDAAVHGMKVGDKVTVTLPPEKAYGKRREELVVTFPASQVPASLRVGQEVQLGSPGQRLDAKVVEIKNDGSAVIDANPPLAGKTLIFDIELAGFRELLAPAEPPEGLAHATFAAGCFWGVELAFQRVAGVVDTKVGYAQGHLEKPSYEDVCGADTGHTEAVRVVYDPRQVSFPTLLETFWDRVGSNATTQDVAGGDVGPQYRSGIYFHDELQKKAAEDSVAALQNKLGQTVVTEVLPSEPFWLAEDYHQQYLEKGGRFGKPQSAEKGATETIRCYG